VGQGRIFIDGGAAGGGCDLNFREDVGHFGWKGSSNVGGEES
jgi:hypothetical protein